MAEIALWCAGLYVVAETQNRWLAIAFALVGFARLLVMLRADAQARAEDLAKPVRGKVF